MSWLFIHCCKFQINVFEVWFYTLLLLLLLLFFFFFYLIQHHSDSTFSFFLETTKPIEAKFHVEPLWDEGKRKFVQMVKVTWPVSPPCPYMVKTLKSCVSVIKKPMTLKVGIKRWMFEYYQVCSNDDYGLTFTFCQIRSPMLLYGKKDKTIDFFRSYCSLWYQSW